ncbi:MAG: type II toxin-antitoxin system RelE/ParE family toxin [Thermodesulfobacteriota bacterium]
MIWAIKFSSKAEGYFTKLDRKLKKRIKKKLFELSEKEDPLTHGDVKPLTGQLRGFYRLRIGEYRIVFSLVEDKKIIAVVNLAPRGGVY